MKRMIVLVGFMLAFASLASADVILAPMLDFAPKAELGEVFEVKTAKFKNVTLDCQSFITGIAFEEMNGKKHDFYLDMFQCEEAYYYFFDSKRDQLPVCLGVDTDTNELLINHTAEKDCL